MNKTQTEKFSRFVQDSSYQIKTGTFLAMGEGLGDDAKEENYLEIQKYLRGLHFNADKDNVDEAVVILEKILKRIVEVAAPTADNGFARKHQTLVAASAANPLPLQLQQYPNVEVRLDIDQLKHQHPTQPIGTRIKGGGSRFVATCNASWHRANTMVYMANWAFDLGVVTVGYQSYHGQSTPVNAIHYEGFCLRGENGRKYVLFHCYPEDGSPLKY